MVCYICFDNAENMVKCIDDKCNTRICKDCFNDYLNHCIEEKNLPKCFSCNYCFVIHGYKNEQNYIKCISEHFRNKNEVKQIINESETIDKMREKRKKIVNDEFPKAVSLTVNILFKHKLSKINKENKEVIKNILNKSNRTCMLSTCNGKLNENLVCLKCDTEFCKNCETKKGPDHVCNPNLVKTINFLKNVPKCPTCGIIIEKSEGCNGMTCASCKTTFDYKTGELSDHGSYNKEVVVKDSTRLSIKYRNISSLILSKLIKIEERIPVVKDLYESMSSLILKNKDDEYITSMFVYILKNKLIYKRFLNFLNDIDEMLLKNESTENILKYIQKNDSIINEKIRI